METDLDVKQFLSTIYRYIQLGVHVRARYDKENGGFLREVCEVCEFHVTHDNVPEAHTIYRKNIDGTEIMNPPSEYLLDYLESQGMIIKDKNYMHESFEKQPSDVIVDVETKLENSSELPDNNINQDNIYANMNIEETNNKDVDETQFFDVFN